MIRHKMRIEAESTLPLYAYLRATAKMQLKQAEECNGHGEFYWCVATLVFCAFAVEAYLNHVGERIMPEEWKAAKWKRPRKKLDLITERANLVPDFKSRPFGTFTMLFRFRNAMAHGRTVTVRRERIVTGYDPNRVARNRYPSAWWEQQSKLKNAQRAVADVEAMMLAIHSAAGLGPTPFGFLGTGRRTVTLVRDGADGSDRVT